MNYRFRILLFCLGTAAFTGCDRITKDLAKQHLQDRVPVTYLHNTIHLIYAENTGAAMNFGDDLPKKASFWLLSILPLAFIGGLAVYTLAHVKEMSTLKLISFILVISGGLGNIIDRIFNDRHVTDFMLLSIGKLHTGIFNVADICVSAGVIGLLLSFRERKVSSV